MRLSFKSILANLLVLMVMLLPLRALAMPVDMSADHCANEDMSVEMPEMNHTNQQTSATDEEQAQNCDCCKQCVSHCSTCANMSVVSLGFLQLSDTQAHEIYTLTADILFTQIPPPPPRPPQIPYV